MDAPPSGHRRARKYQQRQSGRALLRDVADGRLPEDSPRNAATSVRGLCMLEALDVAGHEELFVVGGKTSMLLLDDMMSTSGSLDFPRGREGSLIGKFALTSNVNVERAIL